MAPIQDNATNNWMSHVHDPSIGSAKSFGIKKNNIFLNSAHKCQQITSTASNKYDSTFFAALGKTLNNVMLTYMKKLLDHYVMQQKWSKNVKNYMLIREIHVY